MPTYFVWKFKNNTPTTTSAPSRWVNPFEARNANGDAPIKPTTGIGSARWAANQTSTIPMAIRRSG
jgi:hypothetical protein